MRVIKKVLDGKKAIEVQWEGKWYVLDNNLSEAMTGVYSKWEKGSRFGICEDVQTSGPEYKESHPVGFYKGDFEKVIRFSPVYDWWELSAKEIGEILMARAQKVRTEFLAFEKYYEEARIFVPWEKENKQ